MESGNGGGASESQSSLNFSYMSSKIQRKFASKFKSKKKLVKALVPKWKRRLQSYSLSEAALLLFCLTSLYIVNPDFIVYKKLKDMAGGIYSTLYKFMMQTTIIRAVRGDVKLSNVFNPNTWDPQTCLSLTVTMILVAFFVNNIVLDQWNYFCSYVAKQKLIDLRMGRSKCSKISSEVFDS